jgi:glutamyl-tRNA synthetase
LPELAGRLEKLAEFTPETVEAEMRAFAAAVEVKPGVIINGVRTLVTGQLAGPGLFEIVEILGRDLVVARLRRSY